MTSERPRRFGVLTSGGDAPGMNAAVRSVVKSCYKLGVDAVGIERGYAGLLDGEHRLLSLNDVDGISRFGGTVLLSARSPAFKTPEGQQAAQARLKEMKLDGLVVIGGNGSLTGAHELAKSGVCNVVGIAASIDNDVGHSGLSIGVDTAVNTIVDACDRISDTARAHRRAFIVEVMGRRCGYLAMRSGIAADADAILFAERRRSEDTIVSDLTELLQRCFSHDRNKHRVLIIKAEGVEVPTATLGRRLTENMNAAGMTDVAVRETILGHVVRGGRPSATDRVIGQRLGLSAVTALEEGANDVLLSWDAPGGAGEKTFDPAITRVPLAEMIAETERLLDGTSAVTRRRIAMLEKAEGILAL